MSDTQNQSPLEKLEALEDLFDLYAVDKKRATGGVPFKIHGTTFMVAKVGNARYSTAVAKGFAALFKGDFKDETQREGDAWEEASDAVLKAAFVKHIIVGWDKIKLNGKVYEGWSEEGAEVLKNLEGLLEKIAVFANNHRNYAPTPTEADQKN